MSGIFGYDGYAYQSNVCLNLVLKKISDGKNVQKFLMEVRNVDPQDARKNEFTVDLVIHFAQEDNPHAEITEVKGGGDPDFENASRNLEACAGNILSVTPATTITKQIVVRLADDATSFPAQIARLPIDDKFIGTDGYSEIDYQNIALIKKIIENEVDSRRREHVARGILRILKHFIDFRLRELAWKLREETQEYQSCEISIRDLFYFEDSFADLIQLESKYTKNQALSILLGRNTHGLLFTGGATPYEGQQSPATDSGV